MIEITRVPIEDIRRRADARPVNDVALQSLADSIEQIGLINPIRVRSVPGGYEVVAGAHRFAACDLLGHREIDCLVVEDDDLHAKLAMIDENLMRAELSASERATQTARRKAIYLKLHPETAVGVSQAAGMNAAQERGGQLGHDVVRFDAATAKATGQSERAVRRDAERGEKIVPEAIELIRGTRLDSGAYLDRIKRLTPDEQVATVRRDATAPIPLRGGIANRYAATAAPAVLPDAEAYSRFIKLVDDIEALPTDRVIAGSGRFRSTLGQRASGLADRMNEIMEGLDR